jgi:hypothetical protein
MPVETAYSSAMEVLLDGEDQGLVLWNAFDLVSPLARDLDRRLDRLRARVHGQDHVEAEQLGGILGEAREDIVVEGSTAERQPRRLFSQGLDELGVAVALVDGAVGGEEVEVVLALGVPDAASAGS